MKSKVSDAGPVLFVLRSVPFSGNIRVTELAVHVGGAFVGDLTATGAVVAVGAALTTDDDDDAFTDDVVRVAVGGALVGPDAPAVGKTVAITGSGVDVTGTYIIHGVWVGARVAGGVAAGAELHALDKITIAPSTDIHFKLVIFTTSPGRWRTAYSLWQIVFYHMPFAICN